MNRSHDDMFLLWFIVYANMALACYFITRKTYYKIEQYYTKHVTRLKYTMTSGTKGKIMGDCDYNLNS